MNRKCTLAVILLFVSLASLALPMMSTFVSEGESGIITVRIFNLAEFSICGFVTLLAPILLIAALFIRLPHRAKRLTAIGIFAGGAICTALSGRNAYAWLAAIGTGSIHIYPICAIYGITIFAAVILLVLTSRKENIS